MRRTAGAWTAAGFLAAGGLGMLLYQAAGAQGGRPAQRPGAPGMQRPGWPGGGMPPQMMQRMQQMQKAREQMQKLDAELDRLVAAMNRASGQKKVDAMAAVINKLMEERRIQRQMMAPPPGMGMGMGMGGGMGMRPGMMGGPGGGPAGAGRRP